MHLNEGYDESKKNKYLLYLYDIFSDDCSAVLFLFLPVWKIHGLGK